MLTKAFFRIYKIILILFLTICLAYGRQYIITVDDGPNKYTTMIAKKMKDKGINAIWFLIGDNCQRYKEEMKYLVDNKFIIGNHTFSHDYNVLRNAGLIKMRKEITYVNHFAMSNFNYPVILMRLPYGLIHNYSYVVCRDLKMIILPWTICFDEWKYDNFNRKIISDTIKESEERNVDIVLLHSTSRVYNNLEIIFDELNKTGKIMKLNSRFYEKIDLRYIDDNYIFLLSK